MTRTPLHSPTHAWWTVLPDGLHCWGHRHRDEVVVEWRGGHDVVRCIGRECELDAVVERVRRAVAVLAGPE